MEPQQDVIPFPTSESELLSLIQKSVLEELTRKVGHEINNQLTGIFGYLSLAQVKSKTPAKVQDYIERIHQCCETSQILINNVFLFSDKIGQTKLTTLIEEANAVSQLLFKTDHAFEHEIELKSDDIIFPHAGFKVLLHFFLQLIRNATPEGGTVVTKVHEPDPQENGDDAHWVLIDIHGQTNPEPHPKMIDEKLAECCFCQAVSIKAAKLLVEIWGGKTVLHHDNPEMPIVRLTLPTSPLNSSPFAPAHTPREKRPLSGASPKILLLEDQDAICQFIHEMLQDEGFESVVFKSGHQLDSALPRLDLDSFQLFLLDIFVPGSSGLELAMRIRQRKPDAKLLFYSALTNLDTVEKLFPISSTTIFMPKPFKKEELISNIHEMLEVESV
ncbi:MAG: response regulator [Candidatus Hinthialibacter antarcticus]|nr:response regulator [Candidatus Hinthialibacter antarcticus]